MATVFFGEALGNLRDPYDLIDLQSLELTVHTPQLALVEDLMGNGIRLTGSNFIYSKTSLTGGVIHSVEFLLAGGIQMTSFTGLNHTVPSGGWPLPPFQDAAALFLLAGDDLVVGSKNRDGSLFGAKGHDTVRGFGGGDYLIASNGRDLLIGGGGADEFVFMRNRGLDQIVDFTDDDLPGDDLIAVSQRQFRNMTIIQEGDDVRLDFGDRGALLLLGVDASQIGRDDFTLNNPWSLDPPG